MKGSDFFALFGSHGGLKKSHKKNPRIDGFSGPAASVPSRLVPFIRFVADALRFLVLVISTDTEVSASYFFACLSEDGGRLPFRVFLRWTLHRVARRFVSNSCLKDVTLST